MRPIWFVTIDSVTHVQSGQAYIKDSSNWNGIALAMRLASPGDTIGFRGQHIAPTIGVGSPWSPNTVKWASGPVHDLHVYGLTESASIKGGFQFGPLYGRPYNLHFSDYIHRPETQAAYITHMNSGPYLGLKFTDILIDTSAVGTNGKPLCKWVFRFHGNAQFHIENVHQSHQIGEHFGYSDNVAGDSIIKNCTAVRCGRTTIQIVNRIASGPCSQGNILIEDFTTTQPGWTEGASAFTCSGHLNGTITFRRCKTIDARGGSLVGWWEGGTNHPGYKNAENKSIDHMIVEDCDFSATNSDRDSVMISACSLAEMSQSLVKSNKNCLRLDHQQGYPNTLFKFTDPNPSQWGWQGYHKVIQGYDNQHQTVLTDPQIDALYVP